MPKTTSSDTTPRRAGKALEGGRGANRTASASSARSRKADKLKAPPPALAKSPTKLAILLALLRRPGGVTLEEMTRATGWQAHSVRGAMAGALKRRGVGIDSAKADGVRRYRATADATPGETA